MQDRAIVTIKCQYELVFSVWNHVRSVIVYGCWCQLSVRGKNSKEKLSGFFKTVTQSVDEVLLSNQKDKDEFFDHQRTFLVEYFTRVKDATMKSDRMTKSHKSENLTVIAILLFSVSVLLARYCCCSVTLICLLDKQHLYKAVDYKLNVGK